MDQIILEPTENPKLSNFHKDGLMIGFYNGDLIKLSIKCGKILMKYQANDREQCCIKNILKIPQTPNFLITNYQGYVFQSNFFEESGKNPEELELVKWDRNSMGLVCSLIITHDLKYLITADQNGYIFKWSFDISTSTKKNFIGIFNPKQEGCISSMLLSKDSKHLFTVLASDGQLKKWDIESTQLLVDFGQIHQGNVISVKIMLNNKFLFTSDSWGNIKKWYVDKRELVKNFGQVHFALIRSLMIINDKYLYSSDTSGVLKKWQIRNCQLKVGFGKICDGGVMCMEEGGIGGLRYLLCGAGDGVVKQIGVKNNLLVKVWKFKEKIIFMLGVKGLKSQ